MCSLKFMDQERRISMEMALPFGTLRRDYILVSVKAVILWRKIAGSLSLTISIAHFMILTVMSYNAVYMCVCVVHLWSICKSALSSLQLIVSYFHLGPVFGNQDHFVGLAIFVDTFRNDLQGMDVSEQYSWVLLSLQAPCLEVVPISMGWPFL